MAEMLASSLLWRVLLAIGGWFSALAHSSRIFAWLGRTMRAFCSVSYTHLTLPTKLEV